jgi:hypothetical protein
MTRGMRKRLKVQPSYGYQHPECKMVPPPGVPSSSSALQFDLKLVNWYPKDEVGHALTPAAAAGSKRSVLCRPLSSVRVWKTMQ